MLRFIAFLVFILVLWIGWVVLPLGRKRISLQDRFSTEAARLDELLRQNDQSDSFYGKKIYGPYVRPYLSRNPDLLQRLSRLLGLNQEQMAAKLVMAGMDKTVTAEEILSMKILATIGFVAFMLMALTLDSTFAVLGFLVYIIGAFMPSRLLDQKAAQKREQIEHELPDFLDLLKSVTESGQDLMTAITKVTARMRGPLADEFQKMMIENRTNGGNWKLAMENMAQRNDIESLTGVISDILIAVERGTPISQVLEKEAVTMRQLRNTRLQEKAKAMTVKLLFPMILFCLFPLLVLMLGPLLMQFMSSM